MFGMGGPKGPRKRRPRSENESRRPAAAAYDPGKTVIVSRGEAARAVRSESPRAERGSVRSGGVAAPASRRLMDLATDWFATVLAIARVPELPDPGALRTRALALKDRFESEAGAAGFGAQDVRDAVFALVAFFNETVLSSKGHARDVWLTQPLAVEGFDPGRAGETFFTTLDELRRDRDARIEALEVLYSCLLFGYRGKFRLSPPERLATLAHEVEQDIFAVRGSALHALSPNGARPPERAGETLEGPPRWIPWAWYGGATAGAFLLVFLWQWVAVLLAGGDFPSRG